MARQKPGRILLCVGIVVFSRTAHAVQPCVIFWGAGQSPKKVRFLSRAWLDQQIFHAINISGNRTLGLHLDTVSGDGTAYNINNYYGQNNRTFTDFGSLDISGQKVFGLLNFDYQYADSHIREPLASKVSLDYDQNGLRFDAGDINASMSSGNRFTSFSRQLYGIYGGYRKGPLSFSALTSKSRSTTQTLSFTGNNSPGPYYLQNGQILPDHIQVQVDGKAYVLGQDYTYSEAGGTITFVNLVVPPTSTITVSFESVGINSGGGQVSAVAMTYDFGKLGRTSLSYARQTDPLAGGLKSFTDRFQAYGDASIPYQLEFTPLNPSTAVVTVDGVTQTLNVDYYFDSANTTFLFFYRAIPTTSTIAVTYVPQPTNNNHGNKNVTGFAYSLPFGFQGKDGSLAYSAALGQLSDATTPTKGFATGYDLNYKYKSYTFTGSIDNIPAGFVGIDTTGFQRNEVSSKWTLENKVRRFSYGLQDSNASVISSSTDSNGITTYSSSRSTDLSAYMNYGTANTGDWKLQQAHLAGSSSAGDTKSDQTSLSYSKTLGSFVPKLTFSRTTGVGPITDSSGNTSQGRITLNSIGLGTTYQPSHIWLFSSQTTFDDIKTNTGSGNGRDIDFTANYQGLKKVILTTGYTYSNSGSLASLGQFQNGTGDGYNGNGFSNGLGNGLSTSSFNTSASNIRRLYEHLNWLPSDHASVDLNLTSSAQSGNLTSNSQGTSAQLSTNLQLDSKSLVGFSTTFNNTSFSSSTTATAHTVLYNLFYDKSHLGPWNYRVGFTDLISSGGSQAQDAVTTTFDLSHRLHKNQTLALSLNFGHITNYLAQDQSSIRLSYAYRFLRSVDFVTAYNIRSNINKDSTSTSGAYRARGLDFELRFDFHS